MSYYNYGGYQFPNTMVAPQYIPGQLNSYPQQTPNCQTCDNRWMWIHGGKEAAKSYPLGPNVTMLFMDDENPYEYFRKTDSEGRTIVFKIYPLKEEEEIPPQPIANADPGNYITKEEFAQFQVSISNTLDQLMGKLDNMSSKPYNKPQYNNQRKQVRNDG